MRPATVLGVIAAAALLLGAIVGVRRCSDDAKAAKLKAVDVEVACPDARPLGPDCAPCIAAFCCAEMRVCYGSSDCIDLNDCYVRSGENEGQAGTQGSRAAACLREHSTSATSFLAWDGCARKNCEDVCPRGPEED